MDISHEDEHHAKNYLTMLQPMMFEKKELKGLNNENNEKSKDENNENNEKINENKNEIHKNEKNEKSTYSSEHSLSSNISSNSMPNSMPSEEIKANISESTKSTESSLVKFQRSPKIEISTTFIPISHQFQLKSQLKSQLKNQSLMKSNQSQYKPRFITEHREIRRMLETKLPANRTFLRGGWDSTTKVSTLDIYRLASTKYDDERYHEEEECYDSNDDN